MATRSTATLRVCSTPDAIRRAAQCNGCGNEAETSVAWVDDEGRTWWQPVCRRCAVVERGATADVDGE